MNKWVPLLIWVQVAICGARADDDPRDYSGVLQSQFLDVHDAIATEEKLSKGKYSDKNIKQFPAAQKDWYERTTVGGDEAASYWKKVMPASEMIFRNDPVHIFEEVNVSFPIRLFGQEMNKVVVRRAMKY